MQSGNTDMEKENNRSHREFGNLPHGHEQLWESEVFQIT